MTPKTKLNGDRGCVECDGLGTVYSPASDNDVQKEICPMCEGRGYFEEQDLEEAI